jgi:RNA polymerase sigma-70 factor, ECF subfamily
LEIGNAAQPSGCAAFFALLGRGITLMRTCRGYHAGGDVSMVPADAGQHDLTRMLRDISAGRQQAADHLLPLVYEQLRAIARQRMAGERADHTLQATALVHEAYMKLMGAAPEASEIAWRDRAHFYFAAAEAMRRILVDHARKHGARKRGGDRLRDPVNVCDLAADDDPGQIMALDDALVRLEDADARAADVARLRFFAGLSVEQTAQALGISERTVKREWTYARATLFRLLEEQI